MLAANIVLSKTEAGRDAVQKRTQPMNARQRAVLISINGSLSVGDLCTRFGGAGNEAQVQDVLAQLMQLGLIESLAPMAPEPAPPSATGAGPGAGLTPVPASNLPDWRELRARAGRALHDLMGPDADMLTLRMERAPTERDFIEQLSRAFDLVANSHGADAAQRLRKDLLQPD